MPALMLSGFVFDLRNMPVVVQVVSQVLPATHYMGMIKTLFLAGDNAAMALKNSAILLGYAVVLIYGCARSLRKRLE
jgi:ABC-2 type transport system permease protein